MIFSKAPFLGNSKAMTLAALIVTNLLCALFFIWDVANDVSFLVSGERSPFTAETVAAAVLLVTTLYLSFELKQLLDRHAAMAKGFRAASGEMHMIIDQFFAKWKLSEAERDVALFVLKGLDNDQIASLRGTANGTVRAQCANIYAKSGVEGRPQLISFFFEELLGEPLIGQRESVHSAS